MAAVTPGPNWETLYNCNENEGNLWVPEDTLVKYDEPPNNRRKKIMKNLILIFIMIFSYSARRKMEDWQ